MKNDFEELILQTQKELENNKITGLNIDLNKDSLNLFFYNDNIKFENRFGVYTGQYNININKVDFLANFSLSKDSFGIYSINMKNDNFEIITPFFLTLGRYDLFNDDLSFKKSNDLILIEEICNISFKNIIKSQEKFAKQIIEYVPNSIKKHINQYF